MKNELGNMDNQGTKNKCFLSRDEILTNIYYLQPLTYNNKKVLTTSQLVGVYIYKWNGLTNYASSSYFWTESGVMLLAEILSNANCIGRYHRMNSKNYNMKYSDICQYLIEKYFQSDDVADVYKDMINAEYSNNNKNYETDLTDLSVKDVDLFGDTVVAAQDKDGMIWAGVRWICEGLGLSDGQTKNERLRIQEDLVLSQGGGTKFNTAYEWWKSRDIMLEIRVCSPLACKNIHYAKHERE